MRFTHWPRLLGGALLVGFLCFFRPVPLSLLTSFSGFLLLGVLFLLPSLRRYFPFFLALSFLFLFALRFTASLERAEELRNLVERLSGKGVVEVEAIVEETCERDIRGVSHTVLLLKGWSGRVRVEGIRLAVTTNSKAGTLPLPGQRGLWPLRIRPLDDPTFFRFSFLSFNSLSRNLHGRGSLKSFLQVQRRGGGKPWLTLPARFQESYLRFARKIDIPGERGEVVAALIAGTRKGLSEELSYRWKESGIYHLLALSGAHVALLSLLLELFLGLFGLPPRKRALLQILWAPLFLLFVGFDPPILRAVVTLTLFFVARLLWKDGDVLSLLGLSGVLLLWYDPLALLGVSFLLTYTMTFLLIAAFHAFPLLWNLSGRVEKAFYGLFFGTLFSLPQGIFLFNTAPLGALFSNLAATLFSPPLLVCGFLSLFLHPLWEGGAALFFRFAALWAGFIDKAASLFAPWHMRIPGPPLLPLFLFGTFLLLFLFWKGHRFLTFLLAHLFLILTILWPESRVKGPEVTLLDVGQGESLLLRDPRGGEFLVDTGGSYVGSSYVGELLVVTPLLLERIRSLEGLLLTHLHPDHSGGVFRVMASLRVRRLYLSQRDLLRPEADVLLREAERREIEVVPLEGGERIPFGGAALLVFPLQRRPNPGVTNSDSLVLKVEGWGRRILLTGDAEREREEELLEGGGESLRAEYLKVAHHGSNTSSTAAFLEAVSPRAAFISVGRRNLHGFPSPRVLERLRERGVFTLRTDLRGSLRLILPQERWMTTR